MSVRTTYSAALHNEQVDPDPDDFVLAVVRTPMYGILNVVDRNVDQQETVLPLLSPIYEHLSR